VHTAADARLPPQSPADLMDAERPAVTFRPLERRDFTLLARWLAEPLVARWWNHDTRPEAMERDFGPSIDGEDPAEVCITIRDGVLFGLIQRYRIDDNPEYAAELARVWPLPAGALSIDYLIGDPALRGLGVGVQMIAAFVRDGWRRYADARDVVVPVSVGNRRSWRALERAGFELVARGELTPDNPIDSRDHLIYRYQAPESR
jgi:aminoglycoside 6'-N-acetyltransferase